MKNLNYILIFVFMISSSAVFAQGRRISAPAQKKASSGGGATVGGKTTEFAPKSARDPFLSQEEVEAIKKARADEEKRKQAEVARQAELARQAEIARQKQLELEEEMRRNPARAVIGKIKVNGILGTDAIINGQLKSVGGVVEGARIVRITDTAVTFNYKGQTFVKSLPKNL